MGDSPVAPVLKFYCQKKHSDMNPIRAIIVEDEKPAMDNLAGKLQRSCKIVDIIAQCRTGEEAIKEIHDKEPQLVFLDVQLGTMTGFDVLERLQYIPFEVIFTTSFGQFAVDAINNVNPVAYLVKPVDDKKLVQAVNKARQKLEEAPQPEMGRRIAVPVMNGLEFLFVDDIMYCRANDNYCFIHTVNEGRKLITKPLASMEKKLPGSPFCRIHRSHLVNCNFVKSFSREDGGYVVMQDGTQLRVANNRRDGLLESLLRS